ncbi:hypothetical protein V6N12_035569 [Hibiscus sabdariffa]|uniref:Uncharacterized protein n=1 Tax=Hibiscus sabdariffa TaxID=183260 RepID=A0ABR2ENF6_9ROSI
MDILAPTEKNLVEVIVDKSIVDRLKSCINCTTIDILNTEKLIVTLEENGLVDFDVKKLVDNQFLVDFDREEMVV